MKLKARQFASLKLQFTASFRAHLITYGMPPRIRALPCLTCRIHFQQQTRLFATTNPRQVQPKTNASSLLPPDTAQPPPYPFGHSYFYKQRNTGLYGGAMIQFGNNVSERTEIKTRRRWNPNIVVKSIYSRALGRYVRVKVSTRVLRTIDKVGGLDEYLLGTSAARVKELGEEGWRLRWAVLNAPSMKKTIASEAKVRMLVQGRPEKELKKSTKEPKVKKKRARLEEEGEEFDGGEIEKTIRRRVRSSSHMAEETVPLTMWQRVRRAVTKPFNRN